MQKKILLVLFFAVWLLPSTLLSFQLTEEELAQRAVMEEFLKTAKIEKVERIGEGVTKPRRLYLKSEDMEASAVWKNPSGVQGSILEGWDYEIAAYLLDKLLDLGMVPPTVERSFRMSRGSCQLWVTLEMSELDRRKEEIPIPGDKQEHVDKMMCLLRAWDSLIANIDRSLQNIRYTPDWRLILIDHSRSFRTKDMYTDKLLYGKDGVKGEFLFERLPRKFYTNVKALNRARIQNAIGKYLTPTEIDCLLNRRDLLVAEIDEMISERGEDQVLY